ncbi:MAG: DUF4249 family protein, partial [Prevotellaceae bacterium]|nr:DUF4249 family protein [Prevotellaceae bacterium]
SLTDETSGEATTLASQGGGLYAGDSSFLPQAGHTYRLQFAYDGEEVSATTTIAEMPEGVTFSVTDITAPSFGGGMGGPVAATPLTITWSNPAQDYYLLAVRCIDPDSVRLDSGVVRTMSDVLTQDSAALLSPMQLSYTGRHAVKLCRLQPEYVLLLQRHEQGKTSETVQEVNANVEGGFGIFTGVSAYSGVVVVHK